ncbi:MAG: glycosyl hydrolase [Acidobacteriota bacterium]|nr:glycosyl hydrolase [Acidobacteriota bacterium]
MKRLWILLVIFALVATPAMAKKKAAEEPEKKEDAPMSAATFSGLKMRNIGPAINSGRVSDFAVQPDAHHIIYVATASGNLWKTINAGTTWEPIFDKENSYSIGCVTLDPNNPNVVWVGTGENNSQRSVAFGDGVYKSLDGGQNWENVGLPESEHIGMITVDPRDSNVVYVASQGPLWRSGGERGVYKTTDGGATWERVLHISDDTGVNEVHMDPRDPDVLYASSYQRRRHVYTLVDGGPESAIYKTTDAGATWRKLTEGLPKVDMGKIGMAVSPANPDFIYAIIEAQREKGGTFRSTDRGESWTKMSDYVSGSPQYYNEFIADPKDPNRVYSMDTLLQVTFDGGKTFKRLFKRNKHVDNHALWIDPDNTDHFIVGCDGGIYETFDLGQNYRYFENFPITQFYRVSVDNSKPFYYVYGGTQDNNSMGGPSRTLYSSGISNEDYFITVGGDGYETVVDPTNPNIVYSQWQYGGLVRYDRVSGEQIDIQPQEEPGEAAHRWNWDSPIIISPHSPTRLYYACQRLYRSADRGNKWTAVSPDLSRQIDPNTLPVFGKIQSIDVVAKNMSTSNFGNIVSLTESPIVEGLIYVGTDDGLIQVTEDGGANWRAIDQVNGVPKMTYVSRLEASVHDADTVYATFNNKKQADFKPYVFVSRDRGQTWSSITGDLPDREIVYSLMQDHVKPELLFVGTEFGLYFTVDEGVHWIRLKGGLPTIQVRDIDIQRTENDLALGTFGRGFYILDDYTALREVSEEILEQDAILFPARDALRYVEVEDRIGSRGATFFTAKNPPFGATFTYYLKDGYKTLEDQRIEAEKESIKAGEDPRIPTYDELRKEEEQLDPEIFFTIRDSNGAVVDRIEGKTKKGMHRVTWNLRYPSSRPVSLKAGERPIWGSDPVGPLAMPGTYTVTMSSVVDGVTTDLGQPQEFEVVDLGINTFAADDPAEVHAFQQKVSDLDRAFRGAVKWATNAESRIAHTRKALFDTPGADTAMLAESQKLQTEIDDILVELSGDETRENRNVFTPPSISERVNRIVRSQWDTTSAPTQTKKDGYEWAADAFAKELGRLKALASDLEAFESQLEAAGAPWTPGRLPNWTK